MRTILGIDCGTAITGWAIIKYHDLKTSPTLIDFGTIETHKLSPEADRLLEIGNSVATLIDEFKPNELAIEDIFFFKNAKTVIKVSQARGVVIYKSVEKGLGYFSYTPPQVKQALTGYGRADKKQIMLMIQQLFKLPSAKLQDDAADALAIAYAHWLYQGRTK